MEATIIFKTKIGKIKKNIKRINNMIMCNYTGCCKKADYKVYWAHCMDKDIVYLCAEHKPRQEYIRLFELIVDKEY